MVDRAALEMRFTGNRNVGSNPTLSARPCPQVFGGEPMWGIPSLLPPSNRAWNEHSIEEVFVPAKRRKRSTGRSIEMKHRLTLSSPG